ncbi:MAG: hypothetical protein RL641_698 [Candidatus Parcubacteria bacterium]|jgi:predicted dehydrogenase
MIKIGIIGTHFGKVGLLPAFNSVKGCKVIGVYSKGKNGKYEWQKALASGELDAVAIATPPNEQYKIAKTAMQNGLHVFAEKPLATNVTQAKELLTLAKKNKITHGIDFLFPEIAEWKKVKEMLDKKMFGELQHISVNWNWLSGDIKYERSSWKTSVKDGGGILSFYFSHGFYYLEHFAGKIKSIKTVLTHSKESKNGAEVGADMLFTFANGATGNAQIACNSRGEIGHRLEFQCDNGNIVLENEHAVVDGFSIIIQSNGTEKQIRVKKNAGKKNEDERVKIVKIMAQRFVTACQQKKQMSPSFTEGLRVQELIEKARAGIY